MSIILRKLLHDTKNSTSLLGQLNLPGLAFNDTARDWNPKNRMPHHGLVAIKWAPDDVSFHAPLDSRETHAMLWQTFSEWWNKIVIVDSHHNQLTRKTLVLSIANQDGGGHIDPSLNAAYAAVSRQKTIHWIVTSAQGTRDIGGRLELVSIRQIAHEVLQTLGYAGRGVQCDRSPNPHP